MFIYVSEEKGYWEHVKGGGGVPAMPVRIGVEMAHDGTSADQHPPMSTMDGLARGNG